MSNDRPSRFSTFVAELGRRHVGRIAIAYGAAAFVLLQAGEIILPAFNAPLWSLRLLVVVVLLGFPIALAMAWIYEITPQGIRKTPDLEYGTLGRERPGRLVPRLAFLAITLITAVGAGWWLMTYEPPLDPFTTSPASGRLPSGTSTVSDDPDAPIRSLAVLPFQDFSSEPQPEFAAGMHDALILQLSQIEALRVVSRTSVTRYAGTSLTMPQIAGELGVQAIIEGSVTRAGDRVRIVVQLIHAPSDTHLWSKEYERELTDIIALQGEVAREIASEIQVELTPEEETRFAEAAPVNPEAHEAYLRGRYEQSKGTPEGYESAVRYYQEAVKIDSTFGPAYTGLAGTQLLMGMEDSAQVVALLPMVMDAVEKAIILADTSPEALAVIGAIRSQLAGAEDSLSKAAVAVHLNLDSIAIPNEEWLVRVTEFGSQAQRIAVEQQSSRVESLPREQQAEVIRRLEAVGDHRSAQSFLRKLVENDPGNTMAWDALERLCAVRGDYEGALAVRRERAVRPGATPEEVAAAAELEHAVAGPKQYWTWRLEKLREAEERGEAVPQVDYAAALVALGELDAAIDRLERALASRERGMGTLWGDPIWDPIRSDPRFRELIKKMREVRWMRVAPPKPPS